MAPSVLSRQPSPFGETANTLYNGVSSELWAELSCQLSSHPEEPPVTRSGVTLLKERSAGVAGVTLIKEEPVEWAQVSRVATA